MAAKNGFFKRLTFKKILRYVLYTLIVAVIVMYAEYIRNEDLNRRPRAAEGLAMVAEAKLLVANYYLKYGKFPSDNFTVGLPPPSELKKSGVDSLAISASGLGENAKAFITITFNKKVSAGETLIVSTTPSKDSDDFVWDCYSGTLQNNLRPPECRH